MLENGDVRVFRQFYYILFKSYFRTAIKYSKNSILKKIKEANIEANSNFIENTKNKSKILWRICDSDQEQKFSGRR